MKMYLKWKLAFAIVLLSVLSPFVAQAQQIPMSPVPSENIELYFWRYLPPGYNQADTQKKYPLMIFMHGLGERAVASDQGSTTEMNKVLKFGPPKEIKDGHNMCFRVNGVTECFIVLSPQLPNNTTTWGSEPADLVAYAVEHYNVDTNKIYITGLSMGGMGTIDYIQNNGATLWPYTAQIAATATSPGGGGSLANNDECLAPTRDIPMWNCHVNGDPTSGTRYTDMVNYINAVNGCTPSPMAYLTTLEPVNGDLHNSWSRFYRTDHSYFLPNVYEWFLKNPKSSNNLSPFNAGAYAGSDRFITGSGLTLSGQGGDNDSGVPNGSTVTYKWTKVSGGTATFSNDAIRNPAVSGLTAGVYKFRLTVTDDEGTTDSDIVTITVNSRPTANAGADKTVTLPANSVTLNGSGSDVDGPVTFAWSKVSGPAGGNIVSPTSASTMVNNLEQGVYVFRLTVTDEHAATRTDDVTVTVNPGTGTTTWNSWDIVTQSDPTHQGVVTSSSGSTADVEFYISTDDFGVARGSLLPAWNGTVHNDANARVQNYWALTVAGTTKIYPYAGKSTVARGAGNEPGEANVPSPTGVYDLQLHPPNSDKQMVAAFIAPYAGTYTVSNLSVRKLSTSGTTVKFKVYGKTGTLITTLTTVDDSQAWLTSPTASFSLGTLAAGDRIYFATERDGTWDFDMTEVAWSVSTSTSAAPQSWSSHDIVTQSDPVNQGVVNSSEGTQAAFEFYISNDDFGVTRGSLLPAWNGAVHNDANARVQNYWALTAAGTTKVYPYVGKSTVGRGNEPGESNVPTPSGVFDLQIHPPNSNQQTVAAFIVPINGTYDVSNLAVRRLSTNGTTVKFKVYNSNKGLVTTLTTTDDSQAWVTSSTPSFSLGSLSAGDRIYFATERDGTWDFDMTEVAFKINLNGGGARATMQEMTAENVTQEQPQRFRITIYDGYGQLVKSVEQTALPAELDLANLRSHVGHAGLYIFRMEDSQNRVKTKKILFSE